MSTQTHVHPEYRAPRSLVILAAFVAVVVVVGGLIGTQTTPGAPPVVPAAPPSPTESSVESAVVEPHAQALAHSVMTPIQERMLAE